MKINNCQHNKTVYITDLQLACIECEKILPAAKATDPKAVEAYDNEGKTYYVCNLCNSDIDVMYEADGPDDYIVNGYCPNHGIVMEQA